MNKNYVVPVLLSVITALLISIVFILLDQDPSVRLNKGDRSGLAFADTDSAKIRLAPKEARTEADVGTQGLKSLPIQFKPPIEYEDDLGNLGNLDDFVVRERYPMEPVALKLEFDRSDQNGGTVYRVSPPYCQCIAYIRVKGNDIVNIRVED